MKIKVMRGDCYFKKKKKLKYIISLLKYPVFSFNLPKYLNFSVWSLINRRQHPYKLLCWVEDNEKLTE